MGGRKKRMPSCNGVDRGPIPCHESEQTSGWSFSASRRLDRWQMELMDRCDAKCVTGTVPRGPIDWYAINWRKVERFVRRLQTRIAKATLSPALLVPARGL